MTDPKKNPNKQRRSFFWQRKPLLERELARPVNAVQAIEGRAQPRYRPTFLKGAVVLLAVVAILPTRANGQFGIDTAAIMAALSKMQSLMNTYIAAPLKTINQYEQSTAKYEQEVMYPLTAINQAKAGLDATLQTLTLATDLTSGVSEFLGAVDQLILAFGPGPGH